MSSDSCMQSHGMRHQAADTSISIREWVDEVQPVMRSSECDELLRLAQARECEAAFEVIHESRHVVTGRRHVFPDVHIVLAGGAKLSRDHLESARLVLLSDPKKAFRHAVVKTAMKVAN